MTFSVTFLSPRRQVLFSTALNFMEEHSDYAVLLLLKDYYHKVDGPNQGQKIIQVHKVDGPNQGSRQQSTKWTDPTRVKHLFKSTKWTDPTKGQDNSPHNGRTQPGSQTYTSPQSGRTPPRVKTPVHIMDEPNQVTNLYKPTKWTDPTKVNGPGKD